MHFLFVILVLIDQITKTVFADRDFLLFGLNLHPVRNYGLPFGIDLGSPENFIVLLCSYVVLGWLILKSHTPGRIAHLGKSLFLAGAASNLIDRLVYGYVRDFIDLSLGFVFNFADVFIVLGLALFLLAGSTKTPVVEKV